MTKSTHWFARSLTNQSSFKTWLEPVIQQFRPNWQATGYPASVIDNRQESDLVFSLVLRPARSWPGFKAGQHIQLQVEINGARYQRTFSLSTAPEYRRQTGLVELTIRQQTGGLVTGWLAEHLNKGDQVILSAAAGDFTLPSTPYPMLLIAGGSGITPFRSFIQQLACQKSQQDIHLIYYNQATAPLFAELWPLMAAALPGLKVNLIDTAEKGMINRKQLSELCPDVTDRTAWLCGPYGLINTSRDLLLELGVEDSDIHHELFGPKPLDPTMKSQSGTVHFNQAGMSLDYQGGAPTTLLELAEHAQLNPVSGCRMGVCHQCKCRKSQGLVINTLTGQQSDTGAEDIQLCVSIPIGEVSLEL